MVIEVKVVPTLGDLLDSLMTIKHYYNFDFNETNVLLDDYLNDLRIRRERNLDIDEQKVENDVNDFWKQLILKFVDELLNEIQKRKTTGGEFAKIKIDLEETQTKLPYDKLDIKTLVSYYEKDLKEHYEVIKEKIHNEKHIEKKFNEGKKRGRWEGFIITFVAGVLLYLLGLA